MLTSDQLSEWNDYDGIAAMAVDDWPSLQRKVKKFLKQLFKNREKNSLTKGNENEDCEDAQKGSSFDETQFLTSLTDFNQCVTKLAKRKECQNFITFTLDLFLGHSQIRENLLEKRESRIVRRRLIELFYLLCSSQIEACKGRENLADFILGAYDATLSTEDQSLLRLLWLLESHGINLQRYQPFVWGINGAQFYASKQAQKLAFLKMPSIDEIFRGFGGRRLSNSLFSFPIQVLMTSPEIEIIRSPSVFNSNCYDPRFILPMFYHLLSGQSMMRCPKFISYGALSYTLAALSSHCSTIRTIAYKILALIYHHLTCSSYPKDRHLWIGLLDHIRSGLSEANQRIDSVHTVFLVHLIDVLSKPLGAMYPSARQYLIARQMKPYNFGTLPVYYRICMHLVSASNLESYALFQRFAITWIADSMRTVTDVRLCHRRNVFSDMLMLYTSPLCAADNRPLIFRLITTAAQLYEGVKVLCFDCAIFAWIKNLLIVVPSIGHSMDEGSNKSLVYKLIVTIWDTTFSEFKSRVEPDSENLFYRTFGFEIIDVLSRVIYNTTDRFRIDKFVQICEHMLSRADNQLAFITKLNICLNVPINLESMLIGDCQIEKSLQETIN